MAKSRANSDAKETAGFKPRRAVTPIGQPDEKRVVVRAYMPASLAKDITLYALERDCSVSDLLNTILRKAIPSLKVVARSPKIVEGFTRISVSDEPGLPQGGPGFSSFEDEDADADAKAA